MIKRKNTQKIREEKNLFKGKKKKIKIKKYLLKLKLNHIVLPQTLLRQ